MPWISSLDSFKAFSLVSVIAKLEIRAWCGGCYMSFFVQNYVEDNIIIAVLFFVSFKMEAVNMESSAGEALGSADRKPQNNKKRANF